MFHVAKPRIEMIHIGHGFMTAQRCTTTGSYEFDGYADTPLLPTLADDDKHITVNAGNQFPPNARRGIPGRFSAWRRGMGSLTKSSEVE